jgi:ribonuclease HI
MELLGVIIGLEKLKKPAKVLITSDSKYVIDSVEKGWVFNWQKNNFKDKKNPDLWKRFLEVYSKHDVDFKWIKGHNNHPQNERCDVLAVNNKTPELEQIANDNGSKLLTIKQIKLLFL